MAALTELLSLGYNIYQGLNHQAYSTGAIGFSGREVRSAISDNKRKVLSGSNYYRPIDTSPGRLSGFGRGWGQANLNTQHKVMNLIVQNSLNLRSEDQAILLAIARIESGFNPDAAATTTSASGVFQIVKTTANNLGLSQEKVFDAKSNILAGIELYQENAALLNKRFPTLQGNERAVMLYAFHHDGPTLNYGGAEIARRQMLPFLDGFREVTKRTYQLSD